LLFAYNKFFLYFHDSIFLNGFYTSMTKRQLAPNGPANHEPSIKRLRTDAPELERHNDRNSLNREFISDPVVKSVAVPRIDPTYGQRGALPGLDDGYEGESDQDELSKDAMAYLRTVR
jgi:hypothetical protein